LGPTLEILPEKLEEFGALAAEMIAATEPDPGALSYEWKLSLDETACHVYERYADSAAVIRHCQSLGRLVERLMTICRPIRCPGFVGAPAMR
jgi:quinol monooxygenase YgiN